MRIKEESSLEIHIIHNHSEMVVWNLKYIENVDSIKLTKRKQVEKKNEVRVKFK